MSEDRRKVIHVRDLVIKADNVFIQPRRSHRDPFFGGRRDEREEHDERGEQEHHDHMEDDYESPDRDHHHDRDHDDDDRGERRPFSWI
ncbi:hypothetical protein [Virgibacillus oceani]|uniref:Uncharacterized protein n=1 Tax=Virgibacillus oceani TaxID=1479511 RepID=A0A917HGE0_9BACI|nr:hypothetical protein [Virgibacillus oceani]GGG78212.1 hypothetical protein GCM10011398_24280 [Virgibacillus oceani]